MKKAVCAVMTKNFLAQARVLAQSVRRYNPDLEILVFLADRLEGYFDPSKEIFKLVQLHELENQQMISEMSFYYMPYEFCGAIRPHIHDYIMKAGFEKWIYFDTDMMVFGSLEPVFEELEKADILLTLHINTASTDELMIRKQELPMLVCGSYNSGFTALKNSENTKKFIDWWRIRLRKFCFCEFGSGQFGDQVWFNHAHAHLSGVKTFTHPGMNVAYWNFHERPLRMDDSGKITVNGEPLLAFHFSGWIFENPENVSKHMTLYDRYTNPAWRYISELYKKRLIENGYLESKGWPYEFSKFKDGRVILGWMRKAYFKILNNGNWNCGSPFENYKVILSYEKSKKSILRRIYELTGNFLKAVSEEVKKL